MKISTQVRRRLHMPVMKTARLVLILSWGCIAKHTGCEDMHDTESSRCSNLQKAPRVTRDHLLLQLGAKPKPSPSLPPANMSRPSATLKVMSYNLMGWSSFNANSWKGENVLGKINSWEPDLLGAQEVEKGGWGYQEVEELLMSSTGLTFAGGSQFFKPSKLEKLDQDWTALVGGYWMSMALYKHLDTGREILFYDSHWKHGYGLQQAETIANKIAADRTKHGSPPTILVGDTNQFCKGPKTEALRYLKGELQGSQGFSPVDLVDVHGEDQGRSFSDDNNPDCRVDFILASQGQWSVVQVAVDRGGMGSWGSASDHAPLIANLIPLFA